VIFCSFVLSVNKIYDDDVDEDVVIDVSNVST